MKEESVDDILKNAIQKAVDSASHEMAILKSTGNRAMFERKTKELEEHINDKYAQSRAIIDGKIKQLEAKIPEKFDPKEIKDQIVSETKKNGKVITGIKKQITKIQDSLDETKQLTTNADEAIKEKIANFKVHLKHKDLEDIWPDDHHHELHLLESHPGLNATTQDINDLVSGGYADRLHTHKIPQVEILHGSSGGSKVSDLAYGVAWDGITDFAPSQNAVYDIVSTLAGGACNFTRVGTTLSPTVAGDDLDMGAGDVTATVLTSDTGLMPDANDSAYLGQAGTAFSDLFLAEGGVINWDSGDFTLTQTGDILASAGGGLTFTLPAASQVYINAATTPTTNTDGPFYINAITATDAVEAANISLRDTATTGSHAVRGINLATWSDATVTADSPDYYGLYSNTTVSGVNTTVGVIEAYGVYGLAQIINSANFGTRYSYGVFGSAQGDGGGTSTNYGVYGTAAGADTNWAGYFAGNLYCNGTVSGCTWNGVPVTVGYGGTGLNTIADGSVLATNAADTLTAITWHAAGTKILTNINGTISWEAAGAGAATAWDDVGDPDADTSISVAGFETLITSTLNEAAHTVWTIYDSTADLTAAVTLLKLTFNDNGDADGTFLNCLDNNSADSKFSIGQDGNTLIAGTLGVTGAITGNLTGNCSGTALTVTQAAQGAITSLGTLTTLTVDDITINGNTISSAGASTLAINPTAGQVITFDSTVTLDAGVIGGITTLDGTALHATTLLTDHIGEHTGAHTIVLDNNWTAAGRTCADAGILTTVDINGGSVDGATIGAASASTIIGTTITANTGFCADVNDGSYLGVSGTAFSDLFLASGAVIDFLAGAVTITHSANTLTIAGSAYTTLALGATNITCTGTIDNLTAAHVTTLSVDHIGEHTGSHTIVADNTITAATGASIILPAGGAIKLTLPTTDAQCTGHYTDSFQSGYTAAAGDLVYYGTGGKWLEVDADAVATCKGLLGIAMEAKNDTEAMKVALPGSMVHFDAWTWTTGDTLYAGETLGAIQNAIPTGADAVIKVVGVAIDADTIYFMGSPDQQTTVA